MLSVQGIVASIIVFFAMVSGVGDFYEDYAPFYVDGKYGLIDSRGNVAINPAWEYAGEYREGLISVYSNGEWSFCDAAGITRIVANDAVPSAFYNGIATIRRTDGLCGLIDNKGNIICGYVWDEICAFTNGRISLASRSGKWWLINRSGEAISPVGYDELRLTTGAGAVIAIDGDQYGVLSEAGQVILPIVYDYIGDYCSGLFNVYTDGKWHYMDSQGKSRLTIEVDHALPFRGRCAIVESNGVSYLIDSNGKTVREETWGAIQYAGENLFLAQFQEGGYTYLDQYGMILDDKIYDYATSFRDGYAAVYNYSIKADDNVSGAWTLIDSTQQSVYNFTPSTSLDVFSWQLNQESRSIRIADVVTGERGFVLFPASLASGASPIGGLLQRIPWVSLGFVVLSLMIAAMAYSGFQVIVNRSKTSFAAPVADENIWAPDAHSIQVRPTLKLPARRESVSRNPSLSSRTDASTLKKSANMRVLKTGSADKGGSAVSTGPTMLKIKIAQEDTTGAYAPSEGISDEKKSSRLRINKGAAE